LTLGDVLAALESGDPMLNIGCHAAVVVVEADFAAQSVPRPVEEPDWCIRDIRELG
jgi:hypothetical protein